MTEDDKESGRHEDNELSHVHNVMRDNDIPFIYSEEEDDDNTESD